LSFRIIEICNRNSSEGISNVVTLLAVSVFGNRSFYLYDLMKIWILNSFRNSFVRTSPQKGIHCDLTLSVTFDYCKCKYYTFASVRFEVFTAVTTKNAVFWDVALFKSCVNRRFGGTYRLHLSGQKIRERRIGVSRSAATFPRWFLARDYYVRLYGTSSSSQI
jgi:hypothetical protein